MGNNARLANENGHWTTSNPLPLTQATTDRFHGEVVDASFRRFCSKKIPVEARVFLWCRVCFEPVDLFDGDIGGMGAFARGLKGYLQRDSPAGWGTLRDQPLLFTKEKIGWVIGVSHPVI